MKEIIAGLTELQMKMEKIEAKLTSLDVVDLESLVEAELLTERYHHAVTKLENLILHRRMYLIEKRIAAKNNEPMLTNQITPLAPTSQEVQSAIKQL